MKIITKNLQLETKGFTHILDITNKIQDLFEAENLSDGFALISAVGSTTGITTIEFEPGLVNTDFNKMLDKIAPYGVNYSHNQTWGDDNGGAHLRSAIVGTSQSIPFSKGSFILGTWQQIVFIDFDTRPRSRNIVVQFFGE